MSKMSRRPRWMVAVFLAGAGLISVGLIVSSGQQPPHGQHGTQGRHMEHRFDDPERYARSFDDPARDEWQMPGRVISALGIAEGEAVADIGAGTGYFTVRLAESTPARAVYAVDVEPTMVDYVRERAEASGLDQVVGVVADADSPNLPDAVDVVLIVNTFHHIPNRVAYFTTLRDQLTPGARLAIVDYRKSAPGGGPPDEFRFTVDEIGNDLKQAGYALRSQHDFLPRQNFLIYGPR